jgi:hypothetical protein
MLTSLLFSGETTSFIEAIAGYKQQISEFKVMPCFADVGMFFVDSAGMSFALLLHELNRSDWLNYLGMKKDMIPSPTLCLNAIQAYLPQLIDE